MNIRELCRFATKTSNSKTRNESVQKGILTMRKLAIVALTMVLFMAGAASAQKSVKPWGEWTQKDAQKILDDSAWGRTQTETDTSQMFFSPTSRPTGTDPNLSSSTAAAGARRDPNKVPAPPRAQRTKRSTLIFTSGSLLLNPFDRPLRGRLLSSKLP